MLGPNEDGAEAYRLYLEAMTCETCGRCKEDRDLHIFQAHEVIAALRRRMERAAEEVLEWISVKDRLPEPQVPVIVYATVHEGKKRRLRAQYAPKHTLFVHPGVQSDDEDYDEKTDEYYCKEGWYETSEFEEIHWRIQGEVTHWQPLPSPRRRGSNGRLLGGIGIRRSATRVLWGHCADYMGKREVMTRLLAVAVLLI